MFHRYRADMIIGRGGGRLLPLVPVLLDDCRRALLAAVATDRRPSRALAGQDL
jgi:hypothetical protein